MSQQVISMRVTGAFDGNNTEYRRAEAGYVLGAI